MKTTKKQSIPFARERQSIVDLCLELSHRGFLAGVGGNVALRLSDSVFAVTPSAADYYTMKAEDICMLNVHTLERVDTDNTLTPSVESGLHAALFRRRPDLKASVHTHQPLASAAALLHRPIPLPPEDQDLLGKEVALVPYGPSGSSLLVSALKKTLRDDINAYLLRNHGLVCAAPTLALGLDGVQRVEKAAAAFMLQLIDSNRRSELSPALVAHIQELLKSAIHNA